MKDLIFRLAFLGVLCILLPFLAVSVMCPDDNAIAPSDSLMVFDTHKNKIIKTDLESYLVGVVSAEMPASFENEALKSQCVAARTYAIRKINTHPQEHPDADLCTDFNHCQAYITREEMKKKWESDYNSNLLKIQNAVKSTKGEYLKYGNETAVTVFHACSNGITEKSEDVWGGNIPYLTNVESKGDLNNRNYVSYTEIESDVFRKKLSEFSGVSTDDTKPAVGDIKYTSGNNVETIVLYGIEFKATDIRKIFNLSSTAFEIEYNQNFFKFVSCGSGHGVGMSQYGADFMAKEGASYKEILEHYYPGTYIEKYSQENVK